MRLGHQPADRSGPYRDDALHQARRQGLDPAVPGQADHQEAALKPVWVRARARRKQWVAVIRPGKMLFEMEGVPLDVATEAMRLAAHKLPMPTKFVAREMPSGGE